MLNNYIVLLTLIKLSSHAHSFLKWGFKSPAIVYRRMRRHFNAVLSVFACKGNCLRENGRNACVCKSINYYCSSACHHVVQSIYRLKSNTLQNKLFQFFHYLDTFGNNKPKVSGNQPCGKIKKSSFSYNLPTNALFFKKSEISSSRLAKFTYVFGKFSKSYTKDI